MSVPVPSHGSCRYLSENAKKYRRLGAKSRADIRTNEQELIARRRMSYGELTMTEVDQDFRFSPEVSGQIFSNNQRV